MEGEPLMTTQFPDLKGQSVFITGGGSGIGAVLTDAFMTQGSKVAFVQRRDAGAFCDEMEAKHGVRPLFLSCDITDVPALQNAIGEAANKHGPVTVLVNNAGNDVRHDLSLTVEEWDQNHAINLRPHFFTAQAVAGGMRIAGGGTIINVSSASYMMGNDGYPAYVAANAAITGLTRALARELGQDNIRVRRRFNSKANK